MNEVFTELKTRFYKRATRDQSWQAFASRGWLRALSIVSVVSAWVLLVFAILDAVLPAPAPDLGGYLSSLRYYLAFSWGYVWWAAIASYLVLRKAIYHIATAPREVLDERELEMRDSAFRLGYLVVRRVGLGVAVAAFLTVQLRLSIGPEGKPLVGWLASLEPSRFITFGLTLLFLLVYTAYAFPHVVIAWRQARGRIDRIEPEAVFETPAEWVLAVKRITRVFRWVMYAVVFLMFVYFPLEAFKVVPKVFDNYGLGISALAAGILLMAVFVLWMPFALVRLAWLFMATKSKGFLAARVTLNFAQWAYLVLLLTYPLLNELVRQTMIVGPLENYALYQVGMVVLLVSAIAIVILPSVGMIAATVASRMDVSRGIQ